MTAERIDHAAAARQRIEWANKQQEAEGEFDFSVRDNAILAQAEATLALVEQTRIANLIALGGVSATSIGSAQSMADLVNEGMGW
ncbi:hypothetical protein FHS07_001912 [Microbacterium proteolyticum]|uniref:Uncharacterized protein n=1 Tax=Microbacterium proteolyticum TaxID=1572644 RepID=A0A7W5GFM9_9MICO|nr:hypothetical protein [Microbacterium proteolyticum]MBB3158216.1 hypothetical protein [Microbacterium proteolyticum]